MKEYPGDPNDALAVVMFASDHGTTKINTDKLAPLSYDDYVAELYDHIEAIDLALGIVEFTNRSKIVVRPGPKPQ